MVVERHNSRQQGVALLSVLLVLAVVSVLLLQLQTRSRQELAAMDGRYLLQQGRAWQMGAETLARQALTDGQLRGQPRWWMTLRGEPISYPVDEGLLTLQVHDLRTCFNLNHLAGIVGDESSRTHPDLLPWRLYLNRLEQEQAWWVDLSMTVFLDLARDWMDRDQDVLPEGAETGQYLLEQLPRVAANQPMADLSEVNWLQPENRQRFRLLPRDICLLPDSRLRLNVNTLQESQLLLLWALLEGQVSEADLYTWWLQRPMVGYEDLDDFWQALGVSMPPQEPRWLERVSGRLMLVSDYYRLGLRVQLHGSELEYESDIHLSPQGQVRVHARRRGPVDRFAGVKHAD